MRPLSAGCSNPKQYLFDAGNLLAEAVLETFDV
jgi:hypothetical protein